MTSAIGPGDFVECVNADPQFIIPTGLSAGAIYQVQALTPPRPGRWAVAGLLLVGVRHPGNELGDYNPDRFRPIYRPRADFIESLKQPSPARESEAA